MWIQLLVDASSKSPEKNSDIRSCVQSAYRTRCLIRKQSYNCLALADTRRSSLCTSLYRSLLQNTAETHDWLNVQRSYTAQTRQGHTSIAAVVETSLTSPRKLFIFIIKNIYLLDQSMTNIKITWKSTSLGHTSRAVELAAEEHAGDFLRLQRTVTLVGW